MSTYGQRKDFNPFYTLAAAITICISLFLLTTSKPYMAMAPALGLIFFYLVSRNLEFGYMAIVFLLPFAAYRTLPGLEYLRLHWILAFCLVFFIVVKMVTDKQKKLGLNSKLWIWLLPYFSVSLVVSMYSLYPQTAMKNVILQAVAYLFIGLGMVLVTRKGFSQTLPKVIITSISTGSLLATLGFFFNISWFAEKVDTGGFKRGLGATTDPNSLSLMILFVMPFLARMMLKNKRMNKKLLAMALIAVNLLGLVTTYSRGGMLLLVLLSTAIAFTYIHLLSARYLGLIMALAGFILVAAVAIIPPSYWERQASLVSIGEKTSLLNDELRILLSAGKDFWPALFSDRAQGYSKNIMPTAPWLIKWSCLDMTANGRLTTPI